MEDGSVVEHIHTSDMQIGAFAAHEFDDGHGDRVWTKRGAGSKYTVRSIVRGWSAKEFEASRTVELPEDDEVGEAFDVGEARLELGQDFEDAIGLVFVA
jgi:hypothetical protein